MRPSFNSNSVSRLVMITSMPAIDATSSACTPSLKPPLARRTCHAKAQRFFPMCRQALSQKAPRQLYLALLTASAADRLVVMCVAPVLRVAYRAVLFQSHALKASLYLRRRHPDPMRHALLRAHRQRVVMPAGAAHMCVGFAGPRPSGI
jgi:hypothetical protein